MVVTEGDREALGNRVQLYAVVYSRLTQQAQISAHVVSCWVHAWREPTFWVPAINKGKRKKCVGRECTRTALFASFALATDV